MPSPRVEAQATVSLQEQLAAQYKLVKMGSDTSGYSVVEPGTLLAIQKGGILGVPYSDQSILSTKYESGTVHTPSTLLSKGIGFGMKKFGKQQTTKLFPKGDKVYPTKIDVNLDKDTVAMGIVACECQDLTLYPETCDPNCYAKRALRPGQSSQTIRRRSSKTGASDPGAIPDESRPGTIQES